MGKLTAKEAAGLTAPGRYTDSDGLMLYVDSQGRRYWQLRYSFGGKRKDLSLGPAHRVSLREAREAAADAKEQIRKGVNPAEAKRKDRSNSTTFAEAALEVYNDRKKGWSNGKHQAQWISSLRTYAFPVIGDLPIAHIKRADVLAVLSPIWLSKGETACRVMQRLEAVIDWAVGNEIREDGVDFKLVKKALPRQRRDIKHMAAVPFQSTPTFMQSLAMSPSTPKVRLAVEVMILTAARPSMIRFMEWSEVNLEAALWTVPKEKMKMDREYLSPLPARAVEILTVMQTHRTASPFVFPIGRGGKAMSENTKRNAIRALGFDSTAHGFRSSFKDWSRAARWEDYLSEFQLAHVDQNKTRAAYGRDGQVELRRSMMAAWADFIAGQSPPPCPVPNAQME